MNEEHPAAHLQESVAALRRRATFAVVGLAAAMLARGIDLVLREWSIVLLEPVRASGEAASPELLAQLTTADATIDAIVVAVTVTFVVTGFFFIRWMHRLVALTRALGATIPWTPSQAGWAFIIPFISLVRPYQVLSSTRAALEPENVAPPAPRVDPSAQGDYRSTAFIVPAPAQRLPAALIGLWWGAFLVLSLGGRLLPKDMSTVDKVVSAYQMSMFVDAAALVAGALAITVVRGLTARLEERFRRIRASTPEALAAQGIELGA
ncbi:MAG: DUF4328 domain-containing protein [Labilithrix sp.]|nr:DUF4328 domain-containing protein [Labilithrix sp.]MCW5817905.1 DUF4328 domain-containing protein [Labilithrix sp.]